MEKQQITRWFLGANSGNGFSSLYEGFCRGDGDFLRVIKGGPGCGKSTFMRRIGKAAEARGLEVEYILCSGDPDSLDGVYIPALRLGYADGTAPHIMDPECFGASGDYLNLGAHCNTAALRDRALELELLTLSYRKRYARAYSLLRAAANASPAVSGAYIAEADKAAAAKRAASMAGRELPRAKKNTPRGHVTRRFLGGATCQGRVFLTGTLPQLCERIYRLENTLGLGSVFIDAMADEALMRGFDVTLCPNWLDPSLNEALAIPELGLGFVADCGDNATLPDTCRFLHLDSLPDAASSRSARKKFRAEARLAKELTDLAINSLGQAKQLHDQLESVCLSYVNFTELSEAAGRELARLRLG